MPETSGNPPAFRAILLAVADATASTENGIFVEVVTAYAFSTAPEYGRPVDGLVYCGTIGVMGNQGIVGFPGKN